MNHKIQVNGYYYKLRPIRINDASFIIETRLEDKERNQYINQISDDLSLQVDWLNRYFEREGDYYFVVENKFTQKPEGLIAIYNVEDNKAEWGRWVLQKGSMAAIESVDLIYKAAFDFLKLDELYCRTIEDNTPVVSFHDSIKQKRREIFVDSVDLNGKLYNVVEHYVDREYYKQELQCELEKRARLIFNRNLKLFLGKFEFHHIGVATKSIDKEFEIHKLSGYIKEDSVFSDLQQGIKGQFIVAKGQPRLELLENLEGSTTLNYWIKKGVKMYHFAYLVNDIEYAIETFCASQAKVISPLKESAYFGKRICFLVLKNMFMIELIEQ